MRVNPTNSENNFSVPKAGALGAALGWAATYAVPLTTEEHAYYFTDAVKNTINQKVVASRADEIANITKELSLGGVKPLVKDIFEKSTNTLKENPGKLLKELGENVSIDKAVKKDLTSLFKRVRNSGKITEMTENFVTSLAAKKDNRSALYYGLISGFALMSAALLKKAIDTLFPKAPKKPEPPLFDKETMEDINYIIECGEIPAEMYIFGFGGGGKNAKKQA